MIISIAHTKGGVGKSTLAWNIAISLQATHTTKVFDLDFQQTINLSNQIRKNNKTKKEIDVVIPNKNISLENYTKHTDTIHIFDCGGFDSRQNREAMSISDLIIVPLSISLTEVLGFRTFEAILKNEDIDISKVRIVLNNIHYKTTNFDSIKETINSNYIFFDTAIRCRKEYKQSINAGAGVTESSSKARLEIQNLSKEILSYETKLYSNKHSSQ